MRRFFVLAVLALAAVAVAVPAAWAGSPHFVSVTATRTDNSLTVEGKEAGLGNETQVHIVVTATAECINPGGHHPKAVNKESVSEEGDFPVQNGKASFSLTLTASFQP
jgi:K+-transporting ATPase A subunit